MPILSKYKVGLLPNNNNLNLPEQKNSLKTFLHLKFQVKHLNFIPRLNYIAWQVTNQMFLMSKKSKLAFVNTLPTERRQRNVYVQMLFVRHRSACFFCKGTSKTTFTWFKHSSFLNIFGERLANETSINLLSLRMFKWICQFYLNDKNLLGQIEV